MEMKVELYTTLLKDRLQPGNTKIARRAAVGLPVEMAEYNLVGKEGNPFKGRGAVGGGTPDQFMLAVAVAHEFGAAKLLNNPAGDTLRNELM
jgi:hypothetical protein